MANWLQPEHAQSENGSGLDLHPSITDGAILFGRGIFVEWWGRGGEGRRHGNPLIRGSRRVKGADGEMGVESKGGGTVEDEEAGLFLLMTSSRWFSEKSEP